MRIPLASRAELRLGVPTFRIDHDPDRAAGFDDAGVELRLKPVDSERVDVALQLTAMVPSGARRVAERYAQPAAIVAVAWKPVDGTELVGNVGGGRASTGGVHYTQGVVAASLRQDVGTRWNLFAEAYAFNRVERGGPSRRYVAAGAAWFATPDIAFDARIGGGIGNGHGVDTLASAGAAVRF